MVPLDFICSTDQLEEVVGTRPLPALLKSIDRLDEHCETLLGASPLAIAGYTGVHGTRRAGVIGGSRGFATIETPTRLGLPRSTSAAPGTPFSTLFFVPGWGETLRVNGLTDEKSPGTLVVGEAFVHCAKAIIRSEFWGQHSSPPRTPAGQATEGDALDETMAEFLRASRLVVLTSQDEAGHADASPKGDPPGFIRILDHSTIVVPDRRGNRRTDTYHNVVEDPEVALLAMCPGDTRVLEMSGTARITDDTALRESMTMNGNVPHAAVVVDLDICRLAPSQPITDAAPWDTSRQVDPSSLPRASKIWTDHVKRNPTRGLAAAALRTAANERALRVGLAVDYRHGLY